jgi:Tfp pilus assembly protein PilF
MLSEAEASYTRAIEANLSVTDALQNRGVCRLRRGDSAGARADFERALRIDPDYVPAREQLRAMAR